MSTVLANNWNGFDTQIGVTADFVDPTYRGDWTGPFSATPDGECTQCSFVDIFFPQGLGEFTDTLDILARTVRLEIQWRDREIGGEWTSLPFDDTTFTTEVLEDARDQRGHSIKVQYDSEIVPEIRLRRVTPDNNDSQIFDRVEWLALRSVMGIANTFDEATTCTITIVNSANFGRAAEQLFSTIAARLLPTIEDYCSQDPALYNDPTRFRITRNPINAFIYSTLRAGYSLDALDLESLKECHAYFDTMNYRFDAEIKEDINLFDLQKRILTVGFAEPSPLCGEISVVHDRSTAELGHLFTSHDTIDGFRRNYTLYTTNDDAQRDGVVVEYFDNDLGKPEEVEALLPGDRAERPARARAFGVTDRTHAWRLGIRQRRRERYLPAQVTFNCELKGLNVFYGDIIHIADDLCPNTPGLITEYNPLTLEITTSERARGPIALITNRDGSITRVFNVTVTGAHTMTLDRPIEFPVNCSEEKPRIAMGSLDDVAMKCRVKGIEASGEDVVQIIAEEYIEEIYADDNNEPPVRELRCR